jgi:DNA-binding transcriptional LysR family regulator
MSTEGLAGMSVFVRVVQAGSFSAAARALNQTPSAVSKQIGRLEDRLGARLFNRTTRRLGLTEVGAAFYERSRRILAEVEEAEQAVSHLHAAPRGTLRLDVPTAFGRLYIAPLLPDYLSLYPEVRIDMTMNDRYIDPVEEAVDLIVRIGELTDSSLIARRLAANRRVVCGVPGYFDRMGFPRYPADLAGHNCLVYTYRAARNDWPFVRSGDPAPGAPEVIRVTGSLETNNAESLYVAALGGLGVGLFPLWLAGPDLAAGRLVRALPDYHAPDSAIYAVYPPGRHLSPKVRSFVDFLVEHAVRQWTWGDGTQA